MPLVVSVYRLLSKDVRSAVRDGVDALMFDVEVAGRPAVRVDRVSEDSPPTWGLALAAISGREFPFLRRSASALLLVEADDAAYALAFGHGWRMLAEGTYEKDFGIRIALRCLRPDQVREVIRTELATGARLDLTQVADGAHVRTYGIEQASDIVRKIGGRTDALALQYLSGRKHVSLEGRDALKIPLATSPAGVVEDLRAVREAYDRHPVPELAFIEHLRPLDLGSARGAAAARALIDQLGDPTSGLVGLSLPVALLGRSIKEYEIELGEQPWTCSEVDLKALLAELSTLPVEQRFEALAHAKVYAFPDNGDPEPIETPLSHWLAADLINGENRWVFQYGAFYEITAAYRRMLRDEVRRLLAVDHPWRLPPWAVSVPEERYNKLVGRQRGWATLDRDLERSLTHPKGIEICDLVAPDGALVCVKRAEKASVLSHLFHQAIVAAEALRDGNHARRWLEERLPTGKVGVPHSPHFVFAVQLKRRKLTADSLFTFSQATLHRAAHHLERMGMGVSLVPIPRPASRRLT